MSGFGGFPWFVDHVGLDAFVRQPEVAEGDYFTQKFLAEVEIVCDPDADRDLLLRTRLAKAQPSDADACLAKEVPGRVVPTS